jgi:hypothetical protein
MAELGLDTLIGAAGYPGTTVLTGWHSVGSLLLLKCSRRGRAANAFPLGADPGLGLALGLVALPKATHLTSYSYAETHSQNLNRIIFPRIEAKGNASVSEPGTTLTSCQHEALP